MAMKTKILILCAIIVFCIQAKNNDISYEETCYHYIVPHGPINRPSGSYSCVWNYEITNNSNQNYVTWINRLDSMLVLSQDRQSDIFFNRRVGESYSCVAEAWSNGFTGIAVGSTFVKRIKPKESFTYIVIVPNATDSVTTSVFKSHISVVKEDIACRSLGIMHPIDSMFLFKPNRICLLEDSLIFIHLKSKTK